MNLRNFVFLKFVNVGLNKFLDLVINCFCDPVLGVKYSFFKTYWNTAVKSCQ